MPKDSRSIIPNVKSNIRRTPENESSAQDSPLEYNEYTRYFDAEHFKLVSCANKTFGMNSWSHSITRQDIDCIDYIEGSYSTGAIAVVKVELKDGIYHEELGYGSCFGLANKIISIAIARQEAVLNAMKRAIGSFGRVMMSDIKPETSVEKHVESPSNRTNLQNQNIPPLCCGSNSVPELSTPSLVPSSSVNSNDLKAERKRKQQQLQDEYKRRMSSKMVKEQNMTHIKENVSIDVGEEEEISFISTQELDEMINTAVQQVKTPGPHRSPLISSPMKNSPYSWGNSRFTRKSSNSNVY